MARAGGARSGTLGRVWRGSAESTVSKREEVRRLAAESIARGDPLGWFDDLYRRAAGDWERIPWADLVANPNLTEWLDSPDAAAAGERTLMVGCGLGDDAEAFAARGFSVVAFDISATAIDACRKRFSSSTVEYVTADLLAAPSEWNAAFDLVVESYTLQVLPPAQRRTALVALSDLVRPGGRLLVLCRGRDPSDPAGELPWPLTRDDLAPLSVKLEERSFRDFTDAHDASAVRRFLVLYQKPCR
jgi:SAM-dependent methyltransferase